MAFREGIKSCWRALKKVPLLARACERKMVGNVRREAIVVYL